jgi:hypothetical protein
MIAISTPGGRTAYVRSIEDQDVAVGEPLLLVERLPFAHQERRAGRRRAQAVEDGPLGVGDEHHVERRADAPREERPQHVVEGDTDFAGTVGILQQELPPAGGLANAAPRVDLLRFGRNGRRDRCGRGCRRTLPRLEDAVAEKAGVHRHAPIDLCRQRREEPEVAAGVVLDLAAVERVVRDAEDDHDRDGDDQRPSYRRGGRAFSGVFHVPLVE